MIINKFNLQQIALYVTVLLLAISFASCSNDGIESDSSAGIEAQSLESISKLEFISAIESVKAELPKSLKGSAIDNYFSSLKEEVSLLSNKEISTKSLAELADEVRKSFTKPSKQLSNYAIDSNSGSFTDQFLDDGHGKYYSFLYPNSYDFTKVIYYDENSRNKDVRDYAAFFKEDYSVSVVAFILEIHEEDSREGETDDYFKIFDANGLLNARIRRKVFNQVDSVDIEFLDPDGSHNNITSKFTPQYHPMGGIAHADFNVLNGRTDIYDVGLVDLQIHRNSVNQIYISAGYIGHNNGHYQIETVNIDLNYSGSVKKK